MKGKKVAQTEPLELKNLLNEICVMIGVRVDLSDQEAKREHIAMFATVIGWIQRRYPGYTLAEIRLAYELLVDRRLTDHKGETLEPFRLIDVSSFSATMAAYRRYRENNSELLQVHRNQLLSTPEDTPEPTPEELEKTFEGLLAEAIESARKGVLFPDLGNALYDWLDKQGRIPFDDSQKWEFMRQAEEQVKQNMLADAERSGDFYERRRIHNLISETIFTSNDIAGRTRSHAKYLALNEYLKTLCSS